MNLGIGLGGLVGGFIASTSDPSSFTLLFGLDACTFLVFAAILTRVPPPPRAEVHANETRRGYGAVFRDRPFRSFILLNTLFISVSIALFSELFPVFAKNQASVSEREIGLIFFLNTALIVILQLPVAKLQEGKRRMSALARMSVLFAATWVLVLVGGMTLEAGAATALFAAAFGLFSLGECLHGTVQGPLVSDLAPRPLLGRYMAMSSSSWQVGFIIGPAAGGFVLQAQPYALWPVAAAVCLVGGVWAIALERKLPRTVQRTPAAAEQPALAEA
jgi:predicted MFS family arabinose efflux permease